jgi:dTMP kinase
MGPAAPINGLMKARFITFEGGEGAGKSTQIRRLAARLGEAGRPVVTTREPGGTPTAEAIRRVILSGFAARMGPEAEAMLFAAARADHVDQLIRPALAEGKWVLCDRFTDSTEVYQGATGGVDGRLLKTLERVAVDETRPDLTIILDIPAEVGLARASARGRGQGGGDPDRFEREALALHEARRRAYLDIAAREPDRCVVIDATASEDEVADAVWRAVSGRLLDKAA